MFLEQIAPLKTVFMLLRPYDYTKSIKGFIFSIYAQVVVKNLVRNLNEKQL